MSDLVKRLRDWQTVHPCDADKPEGHLYEEAAACIAALETRVAAALEDALRFYANLPHEWTVNAGPGLTYGSLHLLGEKARSALAAYEATKEQSDG